MRRFTCLTKGLSKGLETASGHYGPRLGHAGMLRSAASVLSGDVALSEVISTHARQPLDSVM
jgi:hypothetical protein